MVLLVKHQAPIVSKPKQPFRRFDILYLRAVHLALELPVGKQRGALINSNRISPKTPTYQMVRRWRERY